MQATARYGWKPAHVATETPWHLHSAMVGVLNSGARCHDEEDPHPFCRRLQPGPGSGPHRLRGLWADTRAVGGLGSRLAKVNQEVALTGQGAAAQVNGVMFTTGRQNLTYLTRQDHIAPHTTSDLLYKAGLKDNSRVVWKGRSRSS